MSCMKTVQNNLDSFRLSWTEAVDLAQNRPLWEPSSTIGCTVMYAKDDDDTVLLITCRAVA